jgi:hypothetical protein
VQDDFEFERVYLHRLIASERCNQSNANAEPLMKTFALFSAGLDKDGQRCLCFDVEIVERKLVGILGSKSWLDPSEYMPFVENARPGDMIILKGIFGLVRLRPRESEDDIVLRGNHAKPL